MANLLDFPPPPSVPSIGERNSRIINEGLANILDYKTIDCKDYVGERKTLACLESTCKQAFMNFEENIIDRIQTKWNKDGFTGILEELRTSSEGHPTLHKLSQVFYDGFTYLHKVKENIFPTKQPPSILHRQELLMICHPHVARIAIGLKDNSVKIISLNGVNNSEQDILLKDKRIDKVLCLAWRPKSAMSLAVGSNRGVLVWLLDPTLTSTRPGSNMTRFLPCKDNTSDISSVSWCNDGKLLACSCLNSKSFWIWNILSQTCTPIHRVGSTTSFLDWSPCGQRLLTVNVTPIFRVWETSTWACEKWSELNGKCTNACWSSCGSYLLFTVENEPLIYYLHFQNLKNSTDAIDISGSGVALKCADVSKCMWHDDVIEVGGSISRMVWDPTNSRLAVTFEGEEGANQPCIALYHTRISPFLQLIPCGFLRGEIQDFPMQIDFVHGYDKGALLSVYWSNDSISLLPLLFNQSLSLSSKENPNPVDTGLMSFNRTVSDIADISNMQNETALYSIIND